MLNSNIVLGTETGKEIIHGSQIYLQYKSHDEPGIGFDGFLLIGVLRQNISNSYGQIVDDKQWIDS